MAEIKTLEEALERIQKLEKDNAVMREKLNELRSRKTSGRKRHNAKWRGLYNDFVNCYESGMSVSEIAAKCSVSERTVFRYKAHYMKLQQMIGSKT